jgi:hypothetical protein
MSCRIEVGLHRPWNDTQSALLEAMGPEAAHTIDGWLGQLAG